MPRQSRAAILDAAPAASQSKPHELNWKAPGPVAWAFYNDPSFARGVMGPIGSGKSALCCMTCLSMALAQAPAADGVRRTRGAVIRNTMPDLKTTTIKTWLDWFPEHAFGSMSWSPPMCQRISLPLPDKTRVECEVFFLALDSEEDVKKLFSLELSWAWINEARFVQFAAVRRITERIGRFPAMKDGGCSRTGLVMDTNAPQEDHWWPIMAGEAVPPEDWSDADKLTMIAPEGYRFFRQPPALIEEFDENNVLTGYRINPEAENIQNLDPAYYPRTIQGKPRSEIETNYLNRYGSTFDGKPVWPWFRSERHVAKEPIPVIADAEVWGGIDFGRTPALVTAQRVGMRWFIQHELIGHDVGAKTFGKQARQALAKWYPGFDVERFHLYGDPTGNQRTQSDDTTPFMMIRAAGLRINPAPTNDVDIRQGAVEEVMCRLDPDTLAPCLTIDARCRLVIRGASGGYHYKRLRLAGSDTGYDERPSKNRFSHPCDALQYLLLGAGEGRRMMESATREPIRPYTARHDYSPFSRAGYITPGQRSPTGRFRAHGTR